MGSCPDCGLGFRGATLSAESGRRSGRDRQASATNSKLAEFEQRLRSAVAHPPFPIYALDGSWSGRRWPAGVATTESVVRRIELGHGDPHDPIAPEIRVATTAADGPASLAYSSAAQQLTYGLWHDGMEHTDAVRAPFADSDPTSGWEAIVLSVEGEDVDFKTLRAGSRWVALASVSPGYVVSIAARGVRPDELQLIVLDDPGPYLDGDGLPWREPGAGGGPSQL